VSAAVASAAQAPAAEEAPGRGPWERPPWAPGRPPEVRSPRERPLGGAPGRGPSEKPLGEVPGRGLKISPVKF